MGRQGITRQAPLAAGAGAYLAPLLGGGPIDDLAEQLGLQESDNASVYDERRYGIPLDMHPLALYYDKAVLEETGLDPDSAPTRARPSRRGW